MTALETRIDTILPTLATKADVQEIRTELQKLGADMQKMNADIRTWALTMMITILGTMLAAIFGISQIYKGATPIVPAQPSPIIVIVPSTITSAAPSSPK